MKTVEQKVQALEAFIEQKEHLKKMAQLRYLFWEATLRCNLNCRHCGSDCVRDDSTKAHEISGELIKRELRQIASRYPSQQCTFAIIGGEPLIRDDIIAIGAYSAELGYKWGITTNGMLLTREMITRLKKANLKTISISLDGTEEDHDALRNCTGSHRRATASIRRLLDDRFYQHFDVICCISSINIDHLEEFMDELYELKVPAVRFTPVFSRGRAGRNSDLTLKDEDYVKMLNFIARQRKLQTDIRVNFSEQGYWGPKWECVIRDDFHYCSSGILIGSILHDGTVIGCPSVSKKYAEGNIRLSSFVDIWTTGFKRYRQDRKAMFAHQCGDCEHWILCEGGGFHLLDQEGVPASQCSLKRIR